jgi:hypothetical protein
MKISHFGMGTIHRPCRTVNEGYDTPSSTCPTAEPETGLLYMLGRHLGVDALALLVVCIHPEECGREHEARLPVGGGALHHLHAPGCAAAHGVVSRTRQQDLHSSLISKCERKRRVCKAPS